MVLPSNIGKSQAKFLSGKSLDSYGVKKVDVSQIASKGITKFLIEKVKKMQTIILSNISSHRSISSGNLYQEVGGQIRTEQTDTKASAYMLLPKYADFVDKGVKGSKSFYPSAAKSPYSYKQKKPPRLALEKHLILKYGTPKSELYAKSKAMQKRIFEKGTKAKKIYTGVAAKFQKEIKDGTVTIVKDAVKINILEL